MGLIDNIRGIFSRSNNNQQTYQQPQRNEEYEKARIAEKIIDLVGKIKKINTFDSSLWNLSNVSINILNRKNLDELNKIYYTLENRLSELTRQGQRSNSNRDALEESKWTGQRINNMSSQDLDRFQRGDDGR